MTPNTISALGAARQHPRERAGGVQIGGGERPETEQAHPIAGGFDDLLKLRPQDMTACCRVPAEAISTLPHVACTSTYLAVRAVKETVFCDVI